MNQKEEMSAAELQDLIEQMNTAKFRLFLLADTTAQITRLLDTEQLTEEVVPHAISLLDADAGCLMLIEKSTERLEMKGHFAFESQHLPELNTISIPLDAEPAAHPAFEILREVVNQGITHIHNDPKIAAHFDRRNLIATPVFGREILGVLVVCDKQGRGGTTPKFTDEDQILLEAFGAQAGIAIENARLYQEAIERQRLQTEMEEAAKIVETLLPDKPPEIPGYDIAGLSIPRRDGVGGDYFDYIPEPDGSWGLAIADVCGKGIQAALLMATLRAGLRLEVVKQQDLQAVAMALNSLIIESSPIDRYVTCFYARLQPDTGTLTSINAGHCFPMVIRSDGRVKRLKAGGLIVGMYPEDMLLEIEEYSVEITQLFSGDVVLLYTDGVTEATNIDGEEYGEARLETLVLQERQKNVNEICSAIYNAVIDFQGDAPQFDDLTLMVVKNKK